MVGHHSIRFATQWSRQVEAAMLHVTCLASAALTYPRGHATGRQRLNERGSLSSAPPEGGLLRGEHNFPRETVNAADVDA